jgi:hypothetical protein
VKQPTVRDRSDADPNLGTVTGRTDLSSGYAAPPTAQVPGCDPGEKCVAEKAERPVTAFPNGSGPLTSRDTSPSSVVNKNAHADLTTSRLATGPAVSNPQIGFRNGNRS